MAVIIAKSVTARNIVGTPSAPETLTNSYTGEGAVVSDAIFIGKSDSVALDITYTMGADETSNTMQVEVEVANPVGTGAPEATDWMLYSTISSGTVTASEWSMSPGSYHVIIDIAAKYIRLSFKETGVATNFGTVSTKLITVN